MNNDKLTVSYEGKNLILIHKGNKKTIEFNCKIGKIENFNNCIVVMIDPPQKIILNENIFGVSYDGKIIWQIRPIKHVGKDSPYTGMIREGNYVKLFNWDGTDLIVEPYTGEIISKGYSK